MPTSVAEEHTSPPKCPETWHKKLDEEFYLKPQSELLPNITHGPTYPTVEVSVTAGSQRAALFKQTMFHIPRDQDIDKVIQQIRSTEVNQAEAIREEVNLTKALT